MATTVKKTVKKNIHPTRYTDNEYAWLKQQAEEEGVSVGEVVRELVKRAMRQGESVFRRAS